MRTRPSRVRPAPVVGDRNAGPAPRDALKRPRSGAMPVVRFASTAERRCRYLPTERCATVERPARLDRGTETTRTVSARARDWLLVVGGIAIIVIAIFQLTIGSSYEPNDIRSHAFDRLGPGSAIV